MFENIDIINALFKSRNRNTHNKLILFRDLDN